MPNTLLVWGLFSLWSWKNSSYFVLCHRHFYFLLHSIYVYKCFVFDHLRLIFACSLIHVHYMQQKVNLWNIKKTILIEKKIFPLDGLPRWVEVNTMTLCGFNTQIHFSYEGETEMAKRSEVKRRCFQLSENWDTDYAKGHTTQYLEGVSNVLQTEYMLHAPTVKLCCIPPHILYLFSLSCE